MLQNGKIERLKSPDDNHPGFLVHSCLFNGESECKSGDGSLLSRKEDNAAAGFAAQLALLLLIYAYYSRIDFWAFILHRLKCEWKMTAFVE